ncbi:SNF2-related protein [Aspergillus oryzae]|uniref:SNF2-related protein n=1 Tax=Aspergillus oryzae TaxID=5062 RepID=A0A1S9D4A9_ASPOZ|nr:SNF2-related protein [Aspergillus oryzae]
MGESAAYVSRNPASTRDPTLGHMSEVSPQTTLGDPPVGPLLEPDSGGLAPYCPGLDPSSPASGYPVYPNEMQGVPSWPDANPSGIAWMVEMENGDHKAGILADDMGLGKTIQALALMKSRPSPSPARRATLVVVPAALILQWEHEIERLLWPHPGRYRAFTHYGNKKRVDFSHLN